MSTKSQIYVNLTGLAFLSFVFAVVFMVGHTREMVDIIASYVQYNQNSYLNISNLAYCLVGVLHMFLSLFILYPHKDIYMKKDMLKITCYLMSAVYIVANLWIFRWFFSNLFSGSFSFDVAQYLKVQNMMFNHMQWISRNAETLFYNHVSALIWFLMAYYFDRDRRLTYKLMVGQIVVAYLIPFVVYYILYAKMVPDWWLKKTIPLLCSDAILTFALAYISKSREAWNRYICPLQKSKRRRHNHHHHHHHESSENTVVNSADTKEIKH